MRYLCLALTFLLLSSATLLAEEDPENDLDICAGTWVLSHNRTWSATRIDDGLTKPIPPTAKIFDCGQRPGHLEAYLSSVKAVVRCSNSSEQEGGFYVEEVQIICE